MIYYLPNDFLPIGYAGQLVTCQDSTFVNNRPHQNRDQSREEWKSKRTAHNSRENSLFDFSFI